MSLREEIARKEKEKKRLTRYVLYFFILIGAVICFFNLLIGMLIVIPLVLLIATAQTVRDINHESQDFYAKIKDEIAPKILKGAIPDVQRFTSVGIDKSEYIASEFTDYCEEFQSNDKMLLPLLIDEQKVEDIELYYVEHKLAQEEKEKFYGSFAKLHLPKDVRTKIKISSEGKYADGNIFKYEMENKTFENVFDVMAMNKNTVVNILTEDVMNLMLQMYKTYGYIVEVSIIRNMLYVRVIGKSLIMQTSEGTEIDRKAVDNHYNIMKELRNLINIIYQNIEKIEIK